MYDFRRNKSGLSRDVASTGLSGMEMADPHYPERAQVGYRRAKMPSSTSSKDLYDITSSLSGVKPMLAETWSSSKLRVILKGNALLAERDQV